MPFFLDKKVLGQQAPRVPPVKALVYNVTISTETELHSPDHCRDQSWEELLLTWGGPAPHSIT